MAQVLTLTANPLLDHIADAALAPGVMNRCTHLSSVAGGKGLNVARVLSRHGHRVTACGFAGGWSGEQLTALVRGDDIDCAFTETEARTRIGFLAQNGVGEGTTGMMEHGFVVRRDEQDRLLADITERLNDTALMIISGSVPDPSAVDLYCRIRSQCQSAGVPCWIDSYGAAMEAVLAQTPSPDLVKPNRQEFGESHDWQRATECHLSDGAAPVMVSTPHGRYRAQPPSISLVNPVGSGDCYLAGLAHARLSGWDLPQQLQYACAAGACNAAQMAVADLDPEHIHASMDSVEVTRV